MQKQALVALEELAKPPVATAQPVAQEPEEATMRTIRDKTLVAWVAPANLEQQGGGVLSIGGTGAHFDAIVFGEIEPGRWMAGSNFFSRTERDQSACPCGQPSSPEPLSQGLRWATKPLAHVGRESSQTHPPPARWERRIAEGAKNQAGQP